MRLLRDVALQSARRQPAPEPAPWWTDSTDVYVLFDQQLRDEICWLSEQRLKDVLFYVLGRHVPLHELLHPERLIAEKNALFDTGVAA